MSQQVHAPSTRGPEEYLVVDLVRCNDGTPVRRAHAAAPLSRIFRREEVDKAVGFDDEPKRPPPCQTGVQRGTGDGCDRGTLSLGFVAMMAEYSVNDPSWLGAGGLETRKRSLFTTPPLTLLLAESYAFKPFVLGLVDESGRIIAGMPIVEVGGPIRGRRWVSLPFTDLCPPLVTDACSGLFCGRDRPGAKRRGRVTSLEVRAKLPGARPTGRPALLHYLPLTADPEKGRKRPFSRLRPANIRAAEKGPAVVRQA